MANYLARVELHSATYSDYENLHSYMHARGYSRYITGDDGKAYHLPTGTYVGNFANNQAALNSALDAANQTGRSSEAIVVDWSSARWQGLSVAAARTA